MRAAIYFTPPPDAALSRLAAEWLGRDAFTGAATRPADPAIDPLVGDPARYGFHATMKAPFRFGEERSATQLGDALAAFCAATDGARIESLALTRLGAFFALTPAVPDPALDALAAATVRSFEPFRAPLTAAERERRRPERLTVRQRLHLDAVGYPYVFEDFRFHMTLTGPVPDAEATRVESALRERFASVIGQPLPVDGLALFRETQPGGAFTVEARHSLRSPETICP